MRVSTDDDDARMDVERPPVEAQTRRRRPNYVVERKLAELDACLADAMTSRPRRSDVDGSIFAEIQCRTDFLRTLIAAEGECHGGERPEHLAEAEARFAVLEGAFDQWARRDVVAAPAEEEQPEEAPVSGSACSCTDSCFGFDVTCGQEATSDAKCDAERKPVVEMTPGATAATVNAERETATTHKSAPAAVTPRRGWRRSAACCGAAGAVAVVALAVGVAIEFAAVAHQNVYVVPT
ncbi:hypothetical protein ABZP36_008138 [Zizania latifolia]